MSTKRGIPFAGLPTRSYHMRMTMGGTPEGGRRERSPRLEPWVYDALLGVGVALVLTLSIAADIDGSGADGWAYLWAVGLGALLLVRRQYPVLVVTLSVGGLIAYYAAGYPPVGVAVPVAAAVFSAAELGRLPAAVFGSLTVVVVSVTYRLTVGHDPLYVLGYDLQGHVLMLAAAIALGDSLRSRRRAQRHADEVAALVAERYRRHADERLAEERLAVARDLHDSLGHAMAVVSLHTNVAREAVGKDDRTVDEALGVIAATTGQTMTDLRRTVSALRQPNDRPGTVLRLADLDRAVFPAEQAGIRVETELEVAERLPDPIEAAAFRIVQESITNIVRHADATNVRVHVRQDDRTLQVRVVNDARSAASNAERATVRGHGIAGMRERAESLGGTLTAEHTSSGFEVRATLPLEEPS